MRIAPALSHAKKRESPHRLSPAPVSNSFGTVWPRLVRGSRVEQRIGERRQIVRAGRVRRRIGEVERRQARGADLPAVGDRRRPQGRESVDRGTRPIDVHAVAGIGVGAGKAGLLISDHSALTVGPGWRRRRFCLWRRASSAAVGSRLIWGIPATRIRRIGRRQCEVHRQERRFRPSAVRKERAFADGLANG
jgi:hypothetical protein